MSMCLIASWCKFTYCVSCTTGLVTGGFPLSERGAPPGFRRETVNPLVARKNAASDHLPAQSGAVVMMHLKNGIHLRLAVTDTRLEESGQPFQDHQSLFVRDRNLGQPIALDKNVEDLPLPLSRFCRGRQSSDALAAEDRAANPAEHFLVEPVPAEGAVGAHSDEVELPQQRQVMRDRRFL